MDASLSTSTWTASTDAARTGSRRESSADVSGSLAQADRPLGTSTSFAESAASLSGLAVCDWPELESEALESIAPHTEPVEHELEVRIVLGRVPGGLRTTPPLSVGRVAVLDTDAHAPVEIWSAKQLIARGQLRTLDGHYCVQITELLDRPTRKLHS